MGYLSSEEQQVVLDFYFRCGSEEDIARGRDLIAANSEASKLYANLEETLVGLDDLKYEPCPENLTALTVARLMLAASAKTAGSQKLDDLIKQEQTNAEFSPIPAPVRSGMGRFWRPAFEILATAAAVVLVAGVLFPSFGAMRDHSRQVACAQNLGQIGRAMAAFGEDNKGRVGDIKVKSGSPWWKIGQQGPEIESNTRYVWQLVKQGYVDGKVFVCGGHGGGQPVNLSTEQMAGMHDFPLRSNISYSVMLLCDKNNSLTKRSRKIIASDMNPIFQRISFDVSSYQKLSEFERVQLNEQLRRMMSLNHRKNGQNVLYCDGTVEFVDMRVINGDDIFTIKGVDVYTGKETPCDVDDVFLVP